MDEYIIEDINGLVYDQEKIYMISPYIPIVMLYDFREKKVGKLCDHPHDVSEKGAFERMLKYGSKLYLFPCRTDAIYYYDLQKQAYIRLLSLESIKENIPNRKFFEIVIYNELIYAVCRTPNLVICINPVNDDVQVWKLNQEILISDRIVLANFTVCIYDDKILYPYSSDMIIEFSICDKNFKVIQMTREEEDYEEKYRCLIGMGMNDLGKQWVYDWYGNVYEIIDKKMIKIEMPSGFEGIYNDGAYEEASKINGILPNGNRLYFVLNSDYRILVYDIHSKSFSWINNTFTAWKEMKRKLAYTAYTQMDENLFLFYEYNDGNIYVLNLNEGFCDKLELRISTNDITDDDYLREYWKKNIFIRDDLKSYMQLIWKDNDARTEKKEGLFGEKIYSALMNKDII